MTLQELLDKQQIIEVLYRYATALDTRRRALLDDVFVEDAIFVVGVGAGRYEGREAIGDVVTEFLGGLEASQHIVTNPVIELDGDRATSRAYLHAQHYMPDQRTGGNTLEIGGTYHDELVRTEVGWRITRRELRVSWTEGNHGIQVESRRRAAPTTPAASTPTRGDDSDHD
jgi:3-phenylpropionate/cinnamic acid dioxygenase small subunit